MALLTESALSRLGSWIERQVLTDTAIIWRNAPTRSGSGGQVDHWTQHEANVPAAVLSGSNPTETVIAGQAVGLMTKTILLPRGTDVLGDDKVQVGSVVYHVIDLYEPSTYEVSRRVLVMRSSLPSGR